MSFFETNQFVVFLYSLCIGVVLGLLYDLFKIARKIVDPKDKFLLLFDLLYTFITSVVLVLFVFKANSGNIRWYEIWCPVLGFLVYRFTISRPVIWVCFKVIEEIRKLLRFILRWVLKPVRWAGRKIGCLARKVCKATAKRWKIQKLYFYSWRKWCTIQKEARNGFRLA